MALGRFDDLTLQYKQGVYSITLDMSGWDKATFQAVAPLAAPISIYGSNDGGGLTGVRPGTAQTAGNFSLIQATNLSSGAAVTTMATAGLYSVPINAQYLRLQGGGADVYNLLMFESKVS